MKNFSTYIRNYLPVFYQGIIISNTGTLQLFFVLPKETFSHRISESFIITL